MELLDSGKCGGEHQIKAVLAQVKRDYPACERYQFLPCKPEEETEKLPFIEWHLVSWTEVGPVLLFGTPGSFEEWATAK